MLNSELRIRNDAAFGDMGAAAPAPSADGVSGLYRQLHAEVMSFIENGSAGAARAPAGNAIELSPQGQWSQAQVQRALAPADDGATTSQQQAFLARIAPLADEASARLGVAPELLSAHAALESGWGQRPIRTADGGESYNLFGIKAGASWRGAVASTPTTEFVQGHAQVQQGQFRAYADPLAGFRDFTQLLLDNPRFHGALQAGTSAQAYAQGLQSGGYATDPNYADKLQRVAARIRATR
jgi:flagellar protein FlgJ